MQVYIFSSVFSSFLCFPVISNHILWSPALKSNLCALYWFVSNWLHLCVHMFSSSLINLFLSLATSCDFFCVFPCQLLSSPVLCSFHLSSAVITCHHLSLYVFTILRMSSPVFIRLQLYSPKFMCLHVLQCVLICLQVSSIVFTCLHICLP